MGQAYRILDQTISGKISLFWKAGTIVAKGLGLAFLSTSLAEAVIPINSKCEPFTDGEKTVLSLTYLGATAGTAEISSFRQGKNIWQFVLLAKTDPIFSLFYRIEDRYEATTDLEKFTPKRLVITINESRQFGAIAQEFQFKNKRVRILDNREDKKKGKVAKDFLKEVPPETVDVISSLFAVRRERLALGKEFSATVLVGEAVEKFKFRVDGEEELPTKIGKIPAWILTASIFREGSYREVPESFLWLAKEGAKQILKIKAKVKVGSVIAYLKSYTAGKTYCQEK